MEDDENLHPGTSGWRNRPIPLSRTGNERRSNDRQLPERTRHIPSNTPVFLEGFPRPRIGDSSRDRVHNQFSNRTPNQRNASQSQPIRPPQHRGHTNITVHNAIAKDPINAGGYQNNHSSNRQHGDPRNRQRRYHLMGFTILDGIAKSDTKDIFLKLNEHKEGLLEMINSPIRRPDVFILIFEILSKVSQSPFEELKSKLILDVCHSDFISNLRNYLMDLPYAEKEKKTQNNLYWRDQSGFWINFITFCGDIVEISPAVAVKRCRALIENVSKTCLEYLNLRHDFELSEEYTLRLDELRNKLISYADGNKPENKDTNENDIMMNMKPPEDFRELSVVPTREDLLDSQPFLRPNIVNGGYSDVEHYLDVQFRLLREDCFGPIRAGINQYLADPHKRKYDNVRVYRNVKFVGPYISNLKIGQLVQIDIENNKQFKKINWAHSKRFLFGSLVLFTKDHNFGNVIVATILDRDNMLLATGRLAISIINSSYGINIRDGDTFTMIESEVYYEPYYHVLKALQAASFPRHLAMQQYIVKVDPASDVPAYLTEDKEYIITPNLVRETSDTDREDLVGSEINETEDILTLRLTLARIRATDPQEVTRFTVLQPESWPPKEELHFNESQYKAYKLALTHEFAVIQGPPGTGKTYVGLNVAKALLQNIQAKNSCLMLVICYTNHALDQFLEEISKVTMDIVRIGNQSRNKAMDQFNLSTLRKVHGYRMSRVTDSIMETKGQLKKSIEDFQESLLLLDILNNDVINCKKFEEEIPEIKLLCDYYKKYPSIRDPLMHWLFENNEEYYSDFNQCLLDYANFNINDMEDNEFNNRRTEHNIMLDEDNDKKLHLASVKRCNTSFSLIDAKIALKNIVLDYMNTEKSFKDRYQAEMIIRDINSKINLFEDMMRHRSREIHLNVNRETDFSRIIPLNRWRLYFMWLKNKINAVKRDVERLQSSVSPIVNAYEETRMVMDMELLRNKKIKVLGMTTSGAARMRKLLQAISPKIVIVEEAAEVLEQHIITSLTKDCQHLILIGDHQQLRPSASYMKLAKQYNIEVSLFERMITNGIHSRRLKVQHRMRPEIAALISPHIYPDLENHPSVENMGDVPGLDNNVFFFSHEYPEEVNPNDSNSKANHKEADMTLALANYLIQQGYTSDDVTILAAYSGQMFYMRKERNNYARLTNVKITVVDNYQGEESKIILLSLVRNNPENNIGFLGTENRICVALSRAKQGFYVFGNIDMLKTKSELWRKIASTLENNGSLGTTLKLKCQVHPDQITLIETPEDFNKVPEGGCLRKCNYQYSCGHICLLYCHGYDREHVQTKCTMKCERVLCDLNHVCPLKCCEDCEPCRVLVKKTLPCGHEMNVFCHREPDDPKNQCLTTLKVTLPSCGHEAEKQCYLAIDKVKCKEKCRQRLEKCGHACVRLCHVAYPDHENYICTKDCGKAKRGCQAELDGDLGKHQCKKQCSEQCDDCNVQVFKKRTNCKHAERVACCVNVDDTPCKKKCARNMECGHHCKKLCSEKCGDCKIMVTKVIPDCNHKIKIECMKNVSRELCNEKCTRTLGCGHPCMERCGAACDRARCKQLTSADVDSPCGHKVQLPCNVYASFKEGKTELKELLKYCKKPCNTELACKHVCKGTCAQCHQGRLHVPCKQTCNQMNICGHQCQEPCNQICPPCNKFCEVQCPHSRCGRICGAPCVQCKEKCSRRCPHGACSRRCSEPCSREACSEACARALPCGHRCRGVCGEPCPDVCRDCRPEQFPTDFLGDQYGDDEKFILLQDCGHVLELENMDNLMLGDRENIQIRQCPFCRKPIINTNRYKDFVNNMFKNDINPIKKRIYGKNTAIDEKMRELKRKVLLIYAKCSQGHQGLSIALKGFTNFMKTQKKMYLLQVEMLLIYCNIIEMITQCWETFKNTKSDIVMDELEENITIILKALKIDLKSKVPIKISEQQQKDIANEIKRLNTIVQLTKLLEAAKHMMNDQSVKIQVNITKSIVFSLSVFDEDKAVESLKTLQKTIKTSHIIITKMERLMIVKAVGLKAGHWYKCPNGHFYCIGECGGANQVSKCADCGVRIGGTSHTLLSDNAHAPEMDGSSFAAYSEAANNLANFMIDN